MRKLLIGACNYDLQWRYYFCTSKSPVDANNVSTNVLPVTYVNGIDELSQVLLWSSTCVLPTGRY